MKKLSAIIALSILTATSASCRPPEPPPPPPDDDIRDCQGDDCDKPKPPKRRPTKPKPPEEATPEVTTPVPRAPVRPLPPKTVATPTPVTPPPPVVPTVAPTCRHQMSVNPLPANPWIELPSVTFGLKKRPGDVAYTCFNCSETTVVFYAEPTTAVTPERAVNAALSELVAPGTTPELVFAPSPKDDGTWSATWTYKHKLDGTTLMVAKAESWRDRRWPACTVTMAWTYPASKDEWLNNSGDGTQMRQHLKLSPR